MRAFELNAVDACSNPSNVRGCAKPSAARRSVWTAPNRAKKPPRGWPPPPKITRPPLPCRPSNAFPARHQDEIVILPVKEVASIVADGELLHLTTARNETYTISYRLKDLEARLSPAHFVRLGRGTPGQRRNDAPRQPDAWRNLHRHAEQRPTA